MRGTGAFDGNICKDYSAIAGLYTEACQIVVRADSSIYSLDDLQGKHISIGASESGTERNAKEILAATGLTSRLVQTENYDYTQAANQLSNHEIDAFFLYCRYQDNDYRGTGKGVSNPASQPK
ncbi:MAG: TAXI family TRAP transporter solute-binding subunit [Clostridium sp.]